MQLRHLPVHLRRRLDEHADGATDELAVDQLLTVMCDWYRDSRITGTRLDADGDMLLAQWGCHDFYPERPEVPFTFDITRQAIMSRPWRDDMWQLRATLFFPPNASLESLGSGNRWCYHPDGMPEFTSFVEASDAFAAIAGRRTELKIDFGQV